MTGKDPFRALEAKLGHVFHDRDLLERALTHKSYLTKADRDHVLSYQRLEFLGDRVLALVIADMLYEAFPEAEEGELARRLTGLVRNESCSAVARRCEMGRFILLGDGERQAGGNKKSAILGDVCEAIIAALYLDGGMAAARDFIFRYWEEPMRTWSKPLRDPKTRLQEWAHSLNKPIPVYREVSRQGPDHALRFVMEAEVSGFDPAKGEGGSKRDAQQKAASALLVREGVWERDEYGE